MAIPSPKPDPNRRWTVEEVLALPDDGMRYELVDGVLLVSPAPRFLHQRVIVDFVVKLRSYLELLGLKRMLCIAPADISWAPDVLVQPDIFVVVPEETHGEWAGMKTLLLVIEVLSPSTRRNDEWTKRLVYQKYGVEEYWIVDADAKSVDVWRLGDTTPRTVTDTLVWRAPSAERECVIELSEIFSEE